MPDAGFASPQWPSPPMTRPPVGLAVSLWVKLGSPCKAPVIPKRLFRTYIQHFCCSHYVYCKRGPLPMCWKLGGPCVDDERNIHEGR